MPPQPFQHSKRGRLPGRPKGSRNKPRLAADARRLIARAPVLSLPCDVDCQQQRELLQQLLATCQGDIACVKNLGKSA